MEVDVVDCEGDVVEDGLMNNQLRLRTRSKATSRLTTIIAHGMSNSP